MHPARIGLLVVLLAFLVLTLWALVTAGGLPAMAEVITWNAWGIQIFFDLVLSLALVCAFVWRDARTRGANPWPWIVATLFTGSIAPLTYFALRPGEPLPLEETVRPTASGARTG